VDFTLNTYKKLLKSLKNKGYSFYTFEELLKSTEGKTICLRHDVDLLPKLSLQFAKIQHSLGIKGTYYFRIVPQSFKPDIIKEISELGHEIGYHYEDVDLALKKLRKDKSKTRLCKSDVVDSAIKLFQEHLNCISEIASVNTICMHGSPLSKLDNKLLWNYHSYKDYGIIGEPYFDIDFNKIFYITDTGRRWDGHKFSIRDKVNVDTPWPEFHKTKDMVYAIENGNFPEQAMITFHPQRWTNNPILWAKEWLFQNTKNQIKRMLIQAYKYVDN